MIFEGFLLGLSTGSYCALTCSPPLIPLLTSRPHGMASTARIVASFLAGRLGAYLLVGAVLGLLGTYTLGYLDPGLERLLSGAAYLVTGAVLIIQGLELGGHKGKACRASRRIQSGGNALIYGFASGFTLCPPFVAAAARVFGQGRDAVQAGAAVPAAADPSTLAAAPLAQGMAYFGLFFAGTALFFLPLLGFGFIRRLPSHIPLIARMVMLALGVYFVLILGAFRLLGVL